jgi:Uma2 family endonuclease
LPGKQELIDGELILMPPPEKKHSAVTIRIVGMLLNTPLRDRVRGDHTGYRIGPGWLEPDVSVLWPDQPEDQKYHHRSPMLAVEILSPGEEMERKLTLYFAEGALEVWVIDIRRKTMTVYVRREQQVIRIDIAESYRSETAQVAVSLAELFAGLT